MHHRKIGYVYYRKTGFVHHRNIDVYSVDLVQMFTLTYLLPMSESFITDVC